MSTISTMTYNSHIAYRQQTGGFNMAIDKNKLVQISFTLPHELLKDIEDYWHEKKLPNRNETIRTLVKDSLERHKSESN